MHMIKGRITNMEIKKALCGSIIVSILLSASERLTLNEGQRSRIQAVQMSYPGDACGLNRMDGESNEIVYGNFDISLGGE